MDLLHLAANQVGLIRDEKHLGRDFKVIHAVLVRSQVFKNNLGPCLLPASEITDEWAQLWNGIPVLVGPHPAKMGKAVSGRNPEIINTRGVGWIYNAKTDTVDGVRRLTSEVWIDLARQEQVSELKAVLDKVAGGGAVELSTGFPVSADVQHGEFQGQTFERVMHPQGADHLVISLAMTGACSVQDGCGLGTNELVEESGVVLNVLNVARKPTFNGTEDAQWIAPTLNDYVEALGFKGIGNVRDLTPDERRRIAEHTLLGDPNGSTIEQVAFFPVVNPRTGKLNSKALRNIMRGAGGQAVAAAVPLRSRDSAKIMARRLLRDEYSANTFMERIQRAAEFLTGSEVRNAMKTLAGRPATATNSAPQAQAWEENLARNMARELEARNGMSPSDQEHANMVREALQKKFGENEKHVSVMDVYSSTTPRQVVFWFSTPFGPHPQGGEFFRTDYTENEGQFEFTEPVKVRRMTTYEEVPVTATQTSAAQNKKPCGCAGTTEEPMNEQDKKELAGLFTEALAPVNARLEKVEQSVGQKATEAANTAVTSAKTEIMTAVAAIGEQVKGLATQVNAEREGERKELVKALSTNSKTQFSEAELEAMPLAALQKIAALANVQVVNFAGRGGPRTVDGAENAEPSFMDVRPYWEQDANNAAAEQDGAAAQAKKE